MKTLIRKLALAAAGAVLASQSLAAPVVSLVPRAAVVQPGQTVDIDVVISGLHSGGTSTLLGGFDLSMQYDAALASPWGLGARAGSAFGDVADPTQALFGIDLSSIGVLHIFGQSLLESSPDDCTTCTGPYLWDLQGDSFTVASMQLVIAPHPPAALLSLSMAAGVVDFVAPDGTPVSVTSSGDAYLVIPEPNLLLLTATALLAVLLSGGRAASARLRPGVGLA